MQRQCATLNVLADAYLGYGSYDSAPELLVPGARTPHLVRLINGLGADIVGLQEAEPTLVAALSMAGDWQVFWSQKQNNKPDGCLTLVRRGITAMGFTTHGYADGTGHILQMVTVEGVVFANTHIKWAPADSPDHVGVGQTRAMLDHLGSTRPAVIFADCNDRPGGPVRALVQAAGFTNVSGDDPTALIGEERAPIDLLAYRGVRATRIDLQFKPDDIPSTECPSDHIPVMATIETE
ncbi:MAG TPA: endonuclease/exonuclease/phosphatase family protein [Candidatus Saccharimonadales bacterium]|nr:endonuclease/exonuclease/phosphatase family protein [Candidatus Saccharimonadales bacterium]